MKASELKYHVEQAGHEPHFFTRKTMRFFGDTMANYGVRSANVKTNYNDDGEYVADGVTKEVWELYRKNPTKYGITSSTYFDKKTFKRVFTGWRW